MSKFKLLIIRFFERFIQVGFIQFLFIKKIITSKITNSLSNNISIINTCDVGGGAAKIAVNLATELQSNFNVRLFVNEKKTKQNLVIEIPRKTYTFVEEVLRREAKAKGWLEFTGFHAMTLLKHEFYRKSKVIHLHNLYGEFFSPVLFKKLFNKKKVIWTLHDESFITGHCSCTLGCERWKRGCGQCPDLSIYPKVNFDNTHKVLKYKKKWITDLQPIIVTPSHWLEKRVSIAYPELKHVQVIPNGIDTSVFQPLDKKVARERLKLPLDTKKIVLFVAEFATKNPFKGGYILRDIISDVDFKDVLFITVGGQHETNFSNHISFPYITNELNLVELYSSADVLLYPTQADNLPLVVLESMSCGTPVIASNLGGIPEIIQHGDNGFLIDNYKDVFEFKKALLKVLNLETDELELVCKSASLTIKTQFSLEKMIQSYLNLYSL
jgi:glycosyltransferase involved in cell wall biosynthesis